MTKKQLQELLAKEEWTEEEKKWLLDYLENSDAAGLSEIMEREFYAEDPDKESPGYETSLSLLQQIRQKIRNSNPARNRRHMSRIWTVRVLAASVLTAALFSVVYLFVGHRKEEQPVVSSTPVAPVKKEIVPGKEGAILTLADGKEIVLDDAENGMLVDDPALAIEKKGDHIVYNKQQPASAVQYNRMTTQRGRQYQLLLSDGSKVWLNAVSSIRFPTTFIGNERRVEITGEAYFEISKDPSMPFHVSVNGIDIEVLGTHFNVNAYSDEPAIRTTLLEGSVKMKSGAASILLKPGQQGEAIAGEALKVIANADTEEAIAWKEGRFLFNRTEIKTIMGQITRWYDVDVVYQGDIPQRFFTGDLSKNTNLAEFLQVLEESKIHFRIEDRKIIVTP